MNGILRPEARPRSIGQLTRSQLDAAEPILATLERAIEELRANPCRRDLDPTELDESRASRIFFLAGEPGTGKTTLYLSLRRVLRRPEARKQLDDLGKRIGKLGDEESHESKILKRARKVVKKATKWCDRVVWLEPLTIETIASTQTNYLAAVLARVDRVLADKLGKRSGEKVAPSLFEQSDLSDALADFQRVRTDIGLAWHGNLLRRAEDLDPDVYAEEVMRAEDARTQINQRVHRVLEGLTEKLYSNEEKPIFVLPIDDLSVNPGPSLEILRLLRMISVQRLFVFAMGDDDFFEEFIFQRFFGELAALAGDTRLNDERQKRVLMARARNLAFDAWRKLLPPGQRARVQVLFWDEALKLKLSEALEPTASTLRPRVSQKHDRRLWRLLKDWSLQLDFGIDKSSQEEETEASGQNRHLEGQDGKLPKNLLEFLGTPGESKILFPSERSRDQAASCLEGEDHALKICKEIGIEDAYIAMQILEIPYRGALDLWIQVADHLHSDQRSQKLDFTWVADQALMALNEQAYMSHTDRERCEDSIKGTQYTQRKLDTSLLSMKSDYGPEASWAISDWASLTVRPHSRWRLEPRYAEPSDTIGSGDSTPGSKKFMPPRPAAWFVLLHDLLVLTRGESLEGAPLTPAWNGHKWAGIRWSPPYSDPLSSETGVFVPWPVPRWPSFWQFDSFLCAWNRVVHLAKKEDETEDCQNTYEEKNTKKQPPSATVDLIDVKGIGEAVAAKLKGIGIDSVAALVAASPEKIAKCPGIGVALSAKLKQAAAELIEQSRLPKKNAIIGSLIYWWVRLAVGVFRIESRIFRLENNEGHVFRGLKRCHLLRNHDPFLDDADTADVWSALGNQFRGILKDLCDGTPACERPQALADAERWLIHLGVMMTPEYGLPPAIVESLLGSEPEIAKKPLWRRPEVSRYIREVRADALEKFLSDDDLEPDATWAELIGWDPSGAWEDHELVFAKDKRFEGYEDQNWKASDWNPRRRDVYLAKKRRLTARGSRTNGLEELYAKKSRAGGLQGTQGDGGR